MNKLVGTDRVAVILECQGAPPGFLAARICLVQGLRFKVLGMRFDGLGMRVEGLGFMV